MMRWLLLEMNSKNIGLFAVFIYTVLVLAPLWLAVDRLIWIAGYDVIDWIQSLERNFVSQGTFQFTLLASIYIDNCNLSNRYSDCVATRQIQMAT